MDLVVKDHSDGFQQEPAWQSLARLQDLIYSAAASISLTSSVAVEILVAATLKHARTANTNVHEVSFVCLDDEIHIDNIDQVEPTTATGKQSDEQASAETWHSIQA